MMKKMASVLMMGAICVAMAFCLVLGTKGESAARPGEFFGFFIDMNTQQARGIAESMAKRLGATVKPGPAGLSMLKDGQEILGIRMGGTGFVNAIILKPGIFGKNSIDRDTFVKFCKAHGLKEKPVLEKLPSGEVLKITDLKQKISVQYRPGDKSRNEIAIMRLF